MKRWLVGLVSVVTSARLVLCTLLIALMGSGLTLFTTVDAGAAVNTGSCLVGYSGTFNTTSVQFGWICTNLSFTPQVRSMIVSMVYTIGGVTVTYESLILRPGGIGHLNGDTSGTTSGWNTTTSGVNGDGYADCYVVGVSACSGLTGYSVIDTGTPQAFCDSDYAPNNYTSCGISMAPLAMEFGAPNINTTPCSVLSIVGPGDVTQMGYADELWAIQTSGTVKKIIFSLSNDPNFAVTTPPTFPPNYGEGIVTNGTNNPGTINWGFVDNYTGNPEQPILFDTNFSTATSGDLPTDITGYCFDGNQWYDWGSIYAMAAGTSTTTGPPTPINLGNGSNCLAGVFGNSNIGLSPSSWVPGLANIMSGALVCLFVPTNVSFDAVGAAIRSHEPFNYVYSAVGSMRALFVAVNTSGGTGCDAPVIAFPSFGSGYFHKVNSSQFTVALPVPDSCSQPSNNLAASVGGHTVQAGDLFGYQTLIREVLALMVWLAFLAIAWRMMPWSRIGDGISTLTGGGDPAGGTGITDEMVDDANSTADGMGYSKDKGWWGG